MGLDPHGQCFPSKDHPYSSSFEKVARNSAVA